MNSASRPSHATILAGPGERTQERMLSLAAQILCSGTGERPCGVCRDCEKLRRGAHPDLIYVRRPLDGKGKPRNEIYVDQVREIVATAPILPNDSHSKVYAICEADRMNPAAQNALLKVLEEPPAFVSFVLMTEDPGALLETVRSRCAVVNLAREQETPPAEAAERAEEYLALAKSGGGLALAEFCRALEGLSANELRDFVRAARQKMCAMLAATPSRELLRLAELMDTADSYLDFNVNVKHISGLIMARTKPAAAQAEGDKK